MLSTSEIRKRLFKEAHISLKCGGDGVYIWRHQCDSVVSLKVRIMDTTQVTDPEKFREMLEKLKTEKSWYLNGGAFTLK